MPDISERRFEEAIERALLQFGPDAYPSSVELILVTGSGLSPPASAVY